MPFQIIRNDITRVKADAIVNTANPVPVIGSGTDSAIYSAAGEKLLLAERKKIGNIVPGRAAVTPAFGLNAEYIIHTVGPVWIDGKHKEHDILRSCYANSLSLAKKLSCNSIAFPLIATGVYGFPKDEALQIALSEINRFLLKNDMKVILVVFDKKSFELSGKLTDNINEYIDENTARDLRKEEYELFDFDSILLSKWRSERSEFSDKNADLVGTDLSHEKTDEVKAAGLPSLPDMSGKSLDEILESAEDTFQQRLFRLIDERGLDEVSVYKKANIDRKLFSRIRSKQDYKPQKKTAVAFAIALELDMPAMLDLLSRAGIAFSPGNKFDLIIAYFVNNNNYDIFEINAALFKYGQPILGE